MNTPTKGPPIKWEDLPVAARRELEHRFGKLTPTEEEIAIEAFWQGSTLKDEE